MGQESGGGTLLTKLVTDILNDSVEILNPKDQEFPHTKPHFLNHTGDGFVLVIRGEKSPLVALLWISEFRSRANSRIRDYQQERKRRFAKIEKKLPRLDFGIGAHFGTVVDIEFNNFDRQGVSSQGSGVLGSSINIAGRVEQCTKDHVCKVLFTEDLNESVSKLITKLRLKRFWKSLGEHRLRGFNTPFKLYDFKSGFHKAWKENRSPSP